MLALSVFNYNHNSEVRGFSGRTESSLLVKPASIALVLPKSHNLEYMLDNNQDMG